MSLRSFKISEAGEVKRKFVPWKTSDGLVCLYDHVAKRVYQARGEALAATAIGSGFHYTVDHATDTLEVRSGTIDDLEILGRYAAIEKRGAGEVTVPAAVKVFNQPLTLSEGVLSFADGTVSETTMADALTLKGGATLAVDVIGTACDTLDVTTFAVTGASVQNPVTIRVNATSADWTADKVIIASGVMASSDCFAVTQTGPEELCAVVEGERLVVRKTQEPVAHWIGPAGGDVGDAANWACTNAAGERTSGLPNAQTIVYFNGNDVPAIPAGADFTAKSVAANVVLTNACDWSGLAVTLSGRIDLNGHNLTVTRFASELEYEITDTRPVGSGGELHLNVARGETVENTLVTLSGSLTLVKEGAGLFTPLKGRLISAAVVKVLGGCVKMPANIQRGDAASPFVTNCKIIVAGSGCFDYNFGVAETYAATYDFVFEIEGSGPDGAGALVNSGEPLHGYHFNRVSLTGDAMMAGPGRIEFRGTTAFDAKGHTLTIANTPVFTIYSPESSFKANKIVVTQGAFFQPSVRASAFSANGVELVNGGTLAFWWENATKTWSFPVTVGEGGGAIRSEGASNTSYVLDGLLTVAAGATLTLNKIATCNSAGTLKNVVNNGTITCSGQTATITGTLSGGGTISGTGISLGGDNSCWSVEYDVDGATNKVNLADVQNNFLANLKKIEVRCGGSDAEKTYDLAPKGSLTAAQVNAIGLTVTDAAKDLTLSASALALLNDRLVLTVRRDTRPEVAHWTGAVDTDVGNPANWACTNFYGEVIGVPCEITMVYLRGGIALQFPADTTIAAKSIAAANVALTGDCDWSGLTAPVSGKIDLKGHDLTVSQLSGELEITDSTAEYAYLDSIASTGSQWIDTKCNPNVNTRIVADFYASPRTQDWGVFFGVTSSADSENVGVLLRYYEKSNYLNGWFCNKDSYTTTKSGSQYSGKRVLAELKSGGMTLNGARTVINLADNPKPYNGPIYLCCGNKGGVAHRPQAMKIYSFKIYEGASDTPVRDFVPVRQVATGKVGLLDRAHDVFYGNANTSGADFTPGVVTNVASAGALHLNVPAGKTVVNTSVTLKGPFTFVKEGAGTFTPSKAGSVAASVVTKVLDGCVKMPADIQSGSGSPFAKDCMIIVKESGCFDYNFGVYKGTAAAYDYAFEIEGAGPNGAGALVNSGAVQWGYHLNRVTLTGDATMAGPGRIDFRSTTAFDAKGHTLTIANTPYLSINNAESSFKANKIVVTQDAIFQPSVEASAFSADSIELVNGGTLAFWWVTETKAWSFPVTVGAGGGVIRSEGNGGSNTGYALDGLLTVTSGATLTLNKGATSNYAGTLKDVVNNGTITCSGQTATITGTLSGTGAITGTGIAFDGDNACWHIDISGKTVQKANLEKAPANFLTNLKAIDISYVKTSGYCDLAPAGDLTEDRLGQITLKVANADTGRELTQSQLRIRNGRLGVSIPNGLVFIIR